MRTMMQQMQADVRAKRLFASTLAKNAHKAGKLEAAFQMQAFKARSEHALAVRALFDAEQALLDARRRAS